ncbi:chloride channel protein [Chloroflexota bacterium]
MLKNRDFYKLILYGAGFGVFAGLVFVVMLRVVALGLQFIWGTVPAALGLADFRLYPLLACMVGGLLVGLLQRTFGDHPKPFQYSLAMFQQTGRFEYQYMPQGISAALTSLWFGVSLGPEAALMDVIGGSAQWFADRVRGTVDLERLTKRAPDQEPSKRWLAIPGIPAMLAAVLVMGGLGVADGFGYHFDPYIPQLMDLVYAVPLALVGVGMGALFIYSASWLQGLARPLAHRPVLLAVLGGIGLGLIASFTQDVLNSGQHELQHVYDERVLSGAILLIVLAMLKILATNLCIATNWKGGNIFPILFASGTMGLAFSVMLPGLHPLVGVVALMSAACTVVLRKAAISVLTLALLLPINLIGVAIVAAAVGAVLMKFLDVFPYPQMQALKKSTPV